MNDNIKSLGCPACGLTGIHACTGRPMKPWTQEEKDKFVAVMEELFNARNDNPL